jgi:hypothetical protein
MLLSVSVILRFRRMNPQGDRLLATNKPPVTDSHHNSASFGIRIEDDDGCFGAKYPADVDVLTFEVAESIRDVERLRGLFDVFGEALPSFMPPASTSFPKSVSRPLLLTRGL